MSHESTRCVSVLYNKHDKIKINCVILENITLIVQRNFELQLQLVAASICQCHTADEIMSGCSLVKNQNIFFDRINKPCNQIC